MTVGSLTLSSPGPLEMTPPGCLHVPIEIGPLDTLRGPG